MRILLVDDDPEIQHVVRLALEKIGGHDVIPAASAAEALERARTEPLDLVLLDVVLPDRDGMAVLAELREGPGRDVPVLLLTAHRGTVEGRASGIAGIIEKPFDPLTLAHDIDRLLNAR